MGDQATARTHLGHAPANYITAVFFPLMGTNRIRPQFIHVSQCARRLRPWQNLLPHQIDGCDRERGLVARTGGAASCFYAALVLGAILAAQPMSRVSSENTLDRIQAGQWVGAWMCWEDKLVSTG